MFRRDLLGIVRTGPSDSHGPVARSTPDADGMLGDGEVVSPSGDTYRIRDGYLDLLPGRTVADNIANFTNYLPGAGSGYEPLWRVRSLSLLTGEKFTNEREMDIVFDLAGLDGGGTFLDLGCSAGLYTRNAAARLGRNGDVAGVDIAPSMLKEAVKKSRGVFRPSYIRADAGRLPFADESFAGALCGGSLNEFGNPDRVMRETWRVLKPGGRVAIMGILRASTTNGRRLQRFLSTGGIRFFAPEEVTGMLTRSGLVAEPLRTYGPVFFAAATKR